MTPRLCDHFSIFGLVFFVLKSLLGIARQWSREKFAILTLKPRSQVKILKYRTWTIRHLLLPFLMTILRQRGNDVTRPQLRILHR